jgi:hypothetical protein
MGWPRTGEDHRPAGSVSESLDFSCDDAVIELMKTIQEKGFGIPYLRPTIRDASNK